jgi:zinc transport system ATP-binding protein
MTEPLVTLEQVSKQYGDTRVLDGVSLTLSPGQIVTLVGPNGAGKTTLAKLAMGLLAPDSGRVHRRPGLRIGYMPQRIRIDDSLPLTVDRFLWLAEPGRTRDRRAALEKTGVRHLRRRPVQQLSGGEMQRVLLARALLRKPDLLVLDEPAQGVDVAGQNALYELLASVREELHCAILMISHDLHMVMAATDQVVCLHHHVCCHGTPEAVSRDPAFMDMFPGAEASLPNLAFYTHEHDHDHGLHGDVEGGHRHD